MKNIISYRAQNDLPQIEMMPVVIDNYLCTLPINQGRCRPLEKMHRGLLAYLKGGVALIQNVLYDKIVSQEIADSRTEICNSCPKNIFPDKTGFVKWADELMQASVGDNKSKDYESLGNCEVCTCSLRAKVWYPGPFKPTAKEMSEFPDFCWQKKEALKNG